MVLTHSTLHLPLLKERIPSDFQNDFEIVKIAVSHDGYALQYASPELKKNFEIVKIAVTKNGCALEFGLALEYASEELQGKYEIVKTALRKIMRT